MGLYILSGVPGTGKTLYAIDKWIIPALKAGRQVVTNIDGLNHDAIALIMEEMPLKIHSLLKLINPDDFDANQQFYKDLPIGCLVVLDEAQNYFGARNFKEKANNDLIPYITKHRHFKHDVVFISQSQDSIDVAVRRVSAITYWLKSGGYSGFGEKNVIVMGYLGGNMEKKPESKNVYRHNTRIYGAYKSYEDTEESKDIKEKKVSVSILGNNKLMAFYLVMALIGVVFVVTKTIPYLTGKDKQKKSVISPTDTRPPASGLTAERGGAGDSIRLLEDCILTTKREGFYEICIYRSGKESRCTRPPLSSLCK